MQFNITFFLQIFNFAVTYWFLNKFMFRPVISFIKRRQQEENKIKKNIENKEKDLLKLEREKKEELTEFKVKMEQKYFVPNLLEPDISIEVSSHVDKQNVEKMVEVAQKILVERVPNVD
ncbi:MAG: ATP synthase F0 subunit B [bacterium]